MDSQLLARQFAVWGKELSLNDVPKVVNRCARRAVLDTIGVIAAGSVHAKVRLLAECVALAKGNCSTATQHQTDAIAAATINGMAGHVWDYDDTSYTGITHSSVITLSATLAVAQEINASDEDALLAFIIGSEISYVLGDICSHNHFMQGWWATGSCALIGAVASVCRLYDMDEEQTANAIGTAAVTAGIQRAISGTDAKPYLCGNVAAQAINLARVAKAGLTGPQDAFEQKNGFFALLNNGHSLFSQVESLGDRWRLETPGLLFKTSPVCSAAHAMIEITAKLLEESDKTADDIVSVEAEVPTLVHASLVFIYPENAQQAQFSLPYCFACAAEHGRVRLKDLQLAEIQSDRKRALMERVTIRVAEDLSSSPMREKYPESTRLTILFAGGKTTSGFCGEAFGMPNRPLTDKDLIKKFNDCLTFAGCSLKTPDLCTFEIIKMADHAFRLTAQ
ncbi:MmgE/PrpD family protein [Kiloniella spongiae]|nr:MmgE/PrpD family protein [Kiloniella spongiae]